jgi:hypothetical protein
MSTPANVHSSDAIDAVRLALISFADQVSDALTELSTEMRRVLEWLEHDRPRYWKNQVRLSIDEVHQAQQALHRCLMFPIAGERPSCYEERAALKNSPGPCRLLRGKNRTRAALAARLAARAV